MQENELLIKDNVLPPDENSIEKEIKALAEELDQIEDTFTSELNILEEKIGLEYSGYAKVAMNIGSAMHDMSLMSGNSRVANKITYAALAATMVIGGIGTYKKNKAHNEYLDKLLNIKKTIAEGRILAMQTALPRLNRSLKNSERMLLRFTSIEIPAEILSDKDKLEFKADQGLRILTLYKTASFFHKLGSYILSEAEAWQRGEHTSNSILPGYSDVYSDINEKFFIPDETTIFDEFLNVSSDSNEKILGRDLILVTDPQGVAYVMNNIDYAYIEPPQTPIGQLLVKNPMVERYNDSVGNVAHGISNIDHDPQYFMKEAWIWSAAGLIVTFLFFSCPLVLKLIIAVLYLIVIWTIRFDFNHRLRLLFYYDAAYVLYEGEKEIWKEAGYVEQPKRDFKRRKAFEGFFKNI